jgi:hypothetical protein
MAVLHYQRHSSAMLDYIGLSTDTKPTPDQVGSRFYESDTGLNSIWTGTAWVELFAPKLDV